MINLIPVHWIAQELAGLPVKTHTNPNGTWSEQQTYTDFSTVSEYIYLNFTPENDWRLRESSQLVCETFVEFVKEHIDHIASIFPLSSDSFNHTALADWKSHDFLKKSWDALGKKFSKREVAGHVFAALVPTAALWSATVSKIVDFFLEDGQAESRATLLALLNPAEKEKEKAEEREAKIQAFIREAIRLNPPIPGYIRTAPREVVLGPETVQPFETVYVSLTSANLDPAVFGSDPAIAQFSRPADKQGIIGLGDNNLVSEKFLFATVPAVLKGVFELKDLKRGPAASGRITSFVESYLGSPREWYFNERGIGQFPDGLVVQYSDSK